MSKMWRCMTYRTCQNVRAILSIYKDIPDLKLPMLCISQHETQPRHPGRKTASFEAASYITYDFKTRVQAVSNRLVVAR